MAKMRITGDKGVHFTFENGITLSIQIGGGNYSDNYDEPIGRRFTDASYELPASTTAEIALWPSGSNANGMVDFGSDTVKGWVPVEEVLRFAEFLRSLPSDLTASEVELAIQPFDWREREAA